MVRAARFELALSTLSTLSLCQLGYARSGAESGDRTQLYPLVERATSPAVSLRGFRCVVLFCCVGHQGVEPSLSAYQAKKVHRTVMPVRTDGVEPSASRV